MTAPMQLDLIRPGDHDLELTDPDTGEVVSLADATDETLAAILRVVIERTQDLYDKKRWLGSLLIERMDANACWTVRGQRVKVMAPAPCEERVEWDVSALAVALDDLVTEGVITREAAARALVQRVEYKALHRGIVAISKIPGVAERIAHARSVVPSGERQVRVSVTS
jgi:hypothetical protein